MVTYIVRRLLYSIPVLFAASVLIFFSVTAVGDPLAALRQNPLFSKQTIHNIEVLSQDEATCKLRFNWTTHSFRYKIVDTYFGTSEYTLDTSGMSQVLTRRSWSSSPRS
jgi:ABC-type dipeptide/oligopeptide/nickel transport system permease component